MTPYRSCAPPRATRKPVITSSKTSSAPLASHSARSASRKPGAGGTTPMLPATGSTRIAASPSPYSATAAATASMSLKGSTIVSPATPDRNAGRRRNPERHQARARAREQSVDVAVIVARELDQPVAARRGAGQPHGAHRRLGSRGHEPHHLDRRHRIHDLGGEVDLALRRRTEGRAPGRARPRPRRGSSGRNGRRAAGPTTSPSRRTCLPFTSSMYAPSPLPHEQRLVEPDRTHRPDRRVDAAGNQPLRPGVQVRPGHQA